MRIFFEDLLLNPALIKALGQKNLHGFDDAF